MPSYAGKIICEPLQESKMLNEKGICEDAGDCESTVCPYKGLLITKPGAEVRPNNPGMLESYYQPFKPGGGM